MNRHGANFRVCDPLRLSFIIFFEARGVLGADAVLNRYAMPELRQRNASGKFCLKGGLDARGQGLR